MSFFRYVLTFLLFKTHCIATHYGNRVEQLVQWLIAWFNKEGLKIPHCKNSAGKFSIMSWWWPGYLAFRVRFRGCFPALVCRGIALILLILWCVTGRGWTRSQYDRFWSWRTGCKVLCWWNYWGWWILVNDYSDYLCLWWCCRSLPVYPHCCAPGLVHFGKLTIRNSKTV